MNRNTLEQAFEAIFHKEYSFDDFCKTEIDKEVVVLNYRGRDVLKTSEKLKKYLRFINKVLLRHLRINQDVVHSYVRGKSSLTAVLAHKDSKYFFFSDIEGFFSSISFEDVQKIFHRDSELFPVSDFSKYTDILVNLVTYENFLPVGFPTSPQISNAYLLDFDNALEKYCRSNGLIYTRYSDDLIISGDALEALVGLEKVVSGFLFDYASENIGLNKNKTRITHLGNKVKVLGLVVTPAGKVTIDSKYKKTIESLIYFYVNDKSKYDDLLNREFRGEERSLFGMLHYAKSIDKDYLDKLQRRYGAFVLNELMKDKWSG